MVSKSGGVFFDEMGLFSGFAVLGGIFRRIRAGSHHRGCRDEGARWRLVTCDAERRQEDHRESEIGGFARAGPARGN